MDNQENYDVLNFAYLFSDTMQMVREETTEHLGRETPRVMLTRFLKECGRFRMKPYTPQWESRAWAVVSKLEGQADTKVMRFTLSRGIDGEVVWNANP